MDTAFLSREGVFERLTGIEPELRRLGVRRLALFGSVARGDARSDSDIDVLLEFRPGEKNFDRFMQVADLLERVLDHKVDVVTLEGLSPFAGPRILAEAVDVVRAA